ncbi:hypothetical protein GBAR_LOCUS31421 [Geodia barretti]|uniref:Uncharacterized protein n=1 Tax=Geodia barretti TaxID=519541 RepID=A0AA35XM99_GEOBA|nr:hypothetical protein GBAR_LOCUS31421 [Geodia barretti]
MAAKRLGKMLADHKDKQHEGGVHAFDEMARAELRNFTDLARRLNPQQLFTSRTPRDVLRLTIKSLATVQKHLSLGPLMLPLKPEKDEGREEINSQKQRSEDDAATAGKKGTRNDSSFLLQVRRQIPRNKVLWESVEANGHSGWCSHQLEGGDRGGVCYPSRGSPCGQRAGTECLAML